METAAPERERARRRARQEAVRLAAEGARGTVPPRAGNAEVKCFGASAAARRAGTALFEGIGPRGIAAAARGRY
ncbi:hypothetical protein ACFSJS_07585 [Streptomyces desertarenae]|uniref:Uncharacterized protein n=1 Tax=Streptomyces desertarenae TaxID=2666184 RepID=A0ABW4PH28_9ACTN